jgi:hypothetical protein
MAPVGSARPTYYSEFVTFDDLANGIISRQAFTPLHGEHSKSLSAHGHKTRLLSSNR